MRNVIKIIMLLFISLQTIYAQQKSTLLQIDSFGNNPGNLKMFIHANPKKSLSKVALVVVLHGCSENAKNVAELTGWNKLADLNDFIVLYPQQKLINNPNLCFNWFNNNDIEKGQGECESIFQMISYVKQYYQIDSNKVFVTGLSAGAVMSVVMTSTHPELFKGGAIFAGGAYKIASNPIDGVKAMLGKKHIGKEKLTSYVKEQNPTYKGSYPSLIIYQGFKDPIVNYKSTSLLVNQWTALNNGDSIPDKYENKYLSIEDINRKTYLDSTGKLIVVLYEVKNLGHQIMVKPGDKSDEGGKIGLFGVNKGFHSTYQTAKEFGIIKTE